MFVQITPLPTSARWAVTSVVPDRFGQWCDHVSLAYEGDPFMMPKHATTIARSALDVAVSEWERERARVDRRDVRLGLRLNFFEDISLHQETAEGLRDEGAALIEALDIWYAEVESFGHMLVRDGSSDANG